jgi:hypothetical protein
MRAARPLQPPGFNDFGPAFYREIKIVIVLSLAWAAASILIGSMYVSSASISVLLKGASTEAHSPESAVKTECARAEQLYEAASSDARILERAIFLSNFREEVERALGKRLSDEELRTLASQARAEAHRWFKYLQEPEHGCSRARYSCGFACASLRVWPTDPRRQVDADQSILTGVPAKIDFECVSKP